VSIFWDQLIELIEEGRVVPVVGKDLLTVPDANGRGLLYPYLAERLARYFDLAADNLPEGGELNEVACRYLAQGGLVEDIYSALKKIAVQADALPIPDPLLKLAAIRPFQLFVTTTFDSSLTRALNQTRFSGNPRTKVFTHAPNAKQDLPVGFKEDGRPIVFHLLGKVSADPSYVVTQEDFVEFFHSLHSDTRRPAMLLEELSRSSLLILGSRFGGWLTRFFIRMAKQQRMSSGGNPDYLVEDAVNRDPVHRDEDLVVFLKRFSRRTKIFEAGGAIEFVNELHKRWMERPERQVTEPAVAAMESGAVFLSYASEDRPAVEKIKGALEAAGVDVFYDRDDLQAGESWEAKLLRNVRECSLFVPVISRQTLTPGRRFFRKEWALAIDEASKASFSDEDVFLLPVVIDDLEAVNADVPLRFKSAQWHRLPNGQSTPDFIARVQQLYRKYQKSLTGAL
jgi:hypothetical protein